MPHTRVPDVHGVPSTMLVTLATRVLAPIELPQLGFRDGASERILTSLGLDAHALCRQPDMLLGTTCRAMFADRITRDFFRRHPHGFGVNMACGLSTNFDRLIESGADEPDWIDIDLPEVIAIRRRFFVDTARRRMEVGDVTDPAVLERAFAAAAGRPMLFIMEGLLFYLPAAQVESIFRRLAALSNHHQASVEMAFDYMVPAGLRAFNRFNFDITDHGARAIWPLSHPRALHAWDDRLEILEIYDYVSRLSLPSRLVNAVYKTVWGSPMIGNVHARRIPGRS